MNVKITWYSPQGKGDPAWNWTCCLYAYLHPETSEILYMGKADGTSVRQRWNRAAKEGFWDDLEHQRRVCFHHVVVGSISLQAGCRLTRQLLADIESLLILRVKPWGNIQCQESRISRSGMIVKCVGGDWPIRQRRFVDGSR